MLIDMSVMPPIQAEYFKRLQMEIVAKKMYFFSYSSTSNLCY